MRNIGKYTIIVGFTALLEVGYACISGASLKHHEQPWSYSGKNGPQNWGNLTKEFSACGTGKYQSPIDIQEYLTANLPNLQINYRVAPLEIINNGHTIKVVYPTGSTMTVDDKSYNLLQFHFHTPAENTINKRKYDMSIHFLHKTDEGSMGVLGVMIEKGEHNKAAQKIWDHLPVHKLQEKKYNDIHINAAELLPKNMEYYSFLGSLTTPPCTEGVNWYVLKHPIQLSSEQIEKFKNTFPMNARPVQRTDLQK